MESVHEDTDRAGRSGIADLDQVGPGFQQNGRLQGPTRRSGCRLRAFCVDDASVQIQNGQGMGSRSRQSSNAEDASGTGIRESRQGRPRLEVPH